MIADILRLAGMLCVVVAFIKPLMDPEVPYSTSLWMLPIGAVMLLISWWLEQRKARK